MARRGLVKSELKRDMRGRPSWPQWQVDFMREHAGKMKPEQIAVAVGRTPGAIRQKASQQAISLRIPFPPREAKVKKVREIRKVREAKVKVLKMDYLACSDELMDLAFKIPPASVRPSDRRAANA